MNFLEMLYGVSPALNQPKGRGFGTLLPEVQKASDIGAGDIMQAMPKITKMQRSPEASALPMQGGTASAAKPFSSEISFSQRLMDIGSALNGDDVPDRAAANETKNATYSALVRRGVSDEDARAAIGNPHLMQSILATTFGPKARGDVIEVFDEQTGQPRKVLLGPDGLMQPIGGVQRREEAITPDITNYRAAKADGFQGTFTDFMVQKKPGAELETVHGREAAARAQGMEPGSDAYRSFVLTGKLPREDQQSLTATDKKAILEADESVMASQNAIDSLNRALELSGKAYDGATANERAWVTSQFGSGSGIATRELNQAVTETALQQLKQIFGGNPTEGERKILLEIQGSAELPQQARDNILRRAMQLAQNRLTFYRDRSAELRGGTFYKPQSEAGPQPAPSGLGGAPIRAKNKQTGEEIEWNGNAWVPVQ